MDGYRSSQDSFQYCDLLKSALSQNLLGQGQQRPVEVSGAGEEGEGDEEAGEGWGDGEPEEQSVWRMLLPNQVDSGCHPENNG